MTKENNSTKATGEKSSVVVRQRKLANGFASLYLDINIHGERTRENLQLYLHPGKSKDVIKLNRQVLLKAEEIALQRKENLSVPKEEDEPMLPNAHDIPLLSYFKELYEEEKEKKGNGICCDYKNTLSILERYCDDTTTVADISKEWLEKFKDFLDRVVPYSHVLSDGQSRYKKQRLSQRTKITYLSTLRKCVEKAYQERIIPDNPFHGEDGVKMYEAVKEKSSVSILTWNELKKLYAAPCDMPTIKRAFLLSCYTGLNFKDLAALRWSDVTKEDGRTRISVYRPATIAPLNVDVPQQALEFLGSRGKGDSHVFEGIQMTPHMFTCLRRWALSANLTKDFTFSTARHSHIMFLLQQGLSEQEVREILGYSRGKDFSPYVKLLKEKNL